MGRWASFLYNLYFKNMNQLFESKNIIWIKNVNTPTGDAYMNLTDDSFRLYFPRQHRTNAASPLLGEIILLFQKINQKRVFTHLVRFIDNGPVRIEANRPMHEFYRDVKIVAMTPLENLIYVSNTKWNDVNFQGISQGNACKIKNISGIENIYDKLVNDVLENFSKYLR